MIRAIALLGATTLLAGCAGGPEPRKAEATGGGVRVTLSTTYRMRSRLDWYAGLWGERMLGDVHDNVLAIIKTRAEG